jgi:hypothetical protein
MKKENKDDLIMYAPDSAPIAETSISDELQKAIQNLIYRLRELGPIPAAHAYKKLNSTAR